MLSESTMVARPSQNGPEFDSATYNAVRCKFLKLWSTSCPQKNFGTDSTSIALLSYEHNLKPSVAVPIIPIEKVRSDRTTRPVADKEIQESVIIIVSKCPIAASPLAGLGSDAGNLGDVSERVISIVAKESIGVRCSFFCIDDV